MHSERLARPAVSKDWKAYYVPGQRRAAISPLPLFVSEQEQASSVPTRLLHGETSTLVGS
jgi:hypothetical protein